MFKECRVVMLPTNEKSQIVILSDTLCYNGSKYLFNSKEYQLQHLYIISDEWIVGGDWCINDHIDTLYQVSNSGSYGNWNKVIASTDPSLKIEEIVDGGKWSKLNIGQPVKQYKFLPQISKSFVEECIERYNAGDPLYEVMVEYEGFICKNGHYMGFQTTCTYPHCEEYNYPQLKISSDNTITPEEIATVHSKKIKTSWNREEVIDLIKRNTERLTNSWISSDIDWIDENL